jgi:hypothetical protein
VNRKRGGGGNVWTKITGAGAWDGAGDWFVKFEI